MYIEQVSRTISRDDYYARSYIPEIDGLRALSILGVISVHMKDRLWGWLAGELGVTIFFVLSGYLITLLALREERSHGRLNLQAFFIRRAFRLFPLYYSVLALYAVAILGLGLSPEKKSPLVAAFPYYLAYMQEWPFFIGIDGSHENVPFYQTWTLGIEEKFYLVWPLLGFVAWRGEGGMRRRATAALMGLMALSPVLIGRIPGQFLYPYSHILAGCLVALLLDDPAWFRKLSILGRPPLAWMSLGLLLALHFSIPQLDVRSDIVWHSAYTIAMALFLISVVLGDGPIHWLLRRPTLLLIGKLSYGIYLIHLFALNAAEKIVLPGIGRPALVLMLSWLISIVMAYLLAITLERQGIVVGRRISAMLIRHQGADGGEPMVSPIDAGIVAREFAARFNDAVSVR